MPAPFAAIEARLNSAVFSRLCNAEAVLDGKPVCVIFDREFQLAFDGIATTVPMATAPSASVATATTASLLVVGGDTYRVRSVQPDGTGATRLLLELQ